MTMLEGGRTDGRTEGAVLLTAPELAVGCGRGRGRHRQRVI